MANWIILVAIIKINRESVSIWERTQNITINNIKPTEGFWVLLKLFYCNKNYNKNLLKKVVLSTKIKENNVW